MLSFLFSLILTLGGSPAPVPSPMGSAVTAPANPTNPPVKCRCQDIGHKSW